MKKIIILFMTVLMVSMPVTVFATEKDLSGGSSCRFQSSLKL